MDIDSLDRFTISGDYGCGVDLWCEDCQETIFGNGSGASLPHFIELAEEHNKEKHEVQSKRDAHKNL